jgi:hypothetical protein
MEGSLTFGFLDAFDIRAKLVDSLDILVLFLTVKHDSTT